MASAKKSSSRRADSSYFEQREAALKIVATMLGAERDSVVGHIASILEQDPHLVARRLNGRGHGLSAGDFDRLTTTLPAAEVEKHRESLTFLRGSRITQANRAAAPAVAKRSVRRPRTATTAPSTPSPDPLPAAPSVRGASRPQRAFTPVPVVWTSPEDEVLHVRLQGLRLTAGQVRAAIVGRVLIIEAELPGELT